MAKLSHQNEEEASHDEVAETLHVWIEWFEANRRHVVGTAVGLLVLLIVWLVFQSHREQSQSDLNAQVSHALTLVSRAQNMSDAKGRAELEKTARQELDRIVDQNASTPLGNEALYLRGNMLCSQDKFVDAEKDYTAYISNAADNETKARGEIGLAYSVENQAFLTSDTAKSKTLLEKARDHYAKARGLIDQGSYLYAYSLMGEARYLELTGDRDGAVKTYETIIKERPAPTPPPSEEREAIGKSEETNLQVRRYVDESLKALSFETTAKMRLERLKAQMAEAKPAATTVVTH